MNDHQNLLAYFQKAEFLTSVPNFRLLPDDHGSEIVFVGRSNSGKSSTINSLCSRKNLARTSRTPGRTQQFNCFNLLADRRLTTQHQHNQHRQPYCRRDRYLSGHYPKSIVESIYRMQCL